MNPQIQLTKICSLLSGYNPPKNRNVVRRASVLIPIVENPDGLHLLLTKRSKNLRSHSGQVSFPGGKEDIKDKSALETALRECHEEIGLKPEEITIFGCLDEIISLHFYLVTPFVGLIPKDFIQQVNNLEIESAFQVPVAFFMNSSNHWSEVSNHRQFPTISHHFQYQDYDIWGLTAKLILRFLELGLGFIPEYPIHHPETVTWIEMAQNFDGSDSS